MLPPVLSAFCRNIEKKSRNQQQWLPVGSEGVEREEGAEERNFSVHTSPDVRIQCVCTCKYTLMQTYTDFVSLPSFELHEQVTYSLTK